MLSVPKQELSGQFAMLPMDDVHFGSGSVGKLPGALEQYGVDRAVIKSEWFVEVTNGEVGTRKVRVLPGLLDLRSVKVDAIGRRAGELSDVLGNGATTPPKVKYFVSLAQLEIVGKDPFEQDLILEN